MDGSRPQRARFIPFRQRDVASMCFAERALAGAAAGTLGPCAGMVARLIHHAFHERLESREDTQAPVAADSGVRPIKAIDDSPLPQPQPR